jgi:lysylphosphatidylglycerol synthetase-like protein (DUF2156 family)
VLAGFLLLAPPIYLLGPLALLLLLAKPKSTREHFWLAVAAAGVSATLAGSVTPGYLLIRISGIALALSFVALSFRSRGPVFPRALISVVLAALVVGIWAALRGLTYPEVEAAFTEMLRASYRSLVEIGGTDPKARQDLGHVAKEFVARPDQQKSVALELWMVER